MSSSETEALLLDAIFINIISKIYGKADVWFFIVNFPFLDGNVTRARWYRLNIYTLPEHKEQTVALTTDFILLTD